MKSTITQADQTILAGADEQQSATIQIDYDLGEVVFLTEALSRVLSVREIANPLYVVVSLASNYGIRASFAMADLDLGYVMIRSLRNGSIEIEADTVLQELENRSRSQFEVDSFDFAAVWIRNLGITLANLVRSRGCAQVVEAAEVRCRRL